MTDHETLRYSGIATATEGPAPDWWLRGKGMSEAPGAGLADRIRQLPRSMEAEVYWRHPGTGDLIKTEKHNALIDPDRTRELGPAIPQKDVTADGFVFQQDVAELPDQVQEQAEDALWHIPTDDYEIINPRQFLDGLEKAIMDHDLSDEVFGEFRLYRRGGRVRGDIYFAAEQLELPWRDDDPVMLGLEVGWDFFGANAAFAQGLGYDGGCLNTMRHITDKRIVRHQGDVDNRIDFWNSMLDDIQLVADTLTQAIIEADGEHVDFRQMPFDMVEFYEFLGFPAYLADRAAEDARSNAADPFEPSLWDLHSGATWAVTHHHRGSEGGSVDTHHRAANDILFNPIESVERVEREYEQAQQEAEEGSFDGSGRAHIAQFKGRLEEKRTTYEDREERIREAFTVAEAE